MNVYTPIKVRDEKALSKEVIRALKFFRIQVKRGLKIKDVLTQIKGSYGKRVHYFVLLSLQNI